jgi:hypothetical protein
MALLIVIIAKELLGIQTVSLDRGREAIESYCKNCKVARNVPVRSTPE